MKKSFEIFGDTRKIGEIKYTFRHFSEYEVAEYNGYYYIIGKQHINGNKQTVAGNKILISLIKLGDILCDNGYFGFYTNKGFVDDNPDISQFPPQIQSKIVTKNILFYGNILSYIIEWCQIYGLPFYEDGKMNLLDDNALNFNTGQYGFRINTFIYRLIHLHSNFYRWRYAVFDEKPDWLKETKKSPESLEWLLSSFSNGISYEVDYIKELKQFEFNWVSDDLFSIVNFQLALLASRINPDGAQIKRCAKCNDWFEASHGNQIYCNKRRGCNAKSAAQALWRKNKENAKNIS